MDQRRLLPRGGDIMLTISCSFCFLSPQCCKVFRDDRKAFDAIVRRQVRQQLGIDEEDAGNA